MVQDLMYFYDKIRLVPDAEERLYSDLKWAGLDWDEGPVKGGSFGPYRQSDRLSIYETHAKQLLEEGKAYRCFCKPEELDRLKEQQLASGVHAQYPGTCSHIPPSESDRRAASGEAHCVRFKAGNERPSVKDLVYGTYVRDGVSEDLIIIKRDGYPTYHFANVVDDHLMEISHVIRGAEWLPSTPRHVQLYDAFGWTPPKFAHVALLVNSERQKLSKRHGDIDIASWRDKGYLPVAMLNYVLLLGWSHGRGPKAGGKVKGHKEVMDLQQMIDNFHLRFTKGDIVVNDKHEHIQKEHMVRLANADDYAPFFAHTLPFIQKAIEKVEHHRSHPSPATQSGPKPESNSASKAAEDMFLKDVQQLNLGELVPQARFDQSANGSNMISVLPYIQSALALDRKNYKTADAYVMKHCYMLWQIPRSEHYSTLQGAYGEFNELLLISPSSSEPVGVKSPASLVRDFRDRLASVAAWERDLIAAQVDPFVKSLRLSADDGTHKVAGYHLVRWVVNALRPGPSLVDSMVVLGRDEVMLRANQAVEVIEQLETEKTSQ